MRSFLIRLSTTPCKVLKGVVRESYNEEIDEKNAERLLKDALRSSNYFSEARTLVNFDAMFFKPED